MPFPRRPYPSKRTAPAKPAATRLMSSDDILWTRTLDTTGTQPREHYLIQYCDRFGRVKDRHIELRMIGHQSGCAYLGVMEAGQFKTLRLDRIQGVLQISTGHDCSIPLSPTYISVLPIFPVAGAVYKVPTTAVSNRTWTVDLNRYSCTCPEKRIRLGRGYVPGELGAICDHIARAILAHLPPAAGWQPELLTFLGDPRKVNIANLPGR